MKKIIGVMLFLAFCAVAADAQDSRMGVGLSAGLGGSGFFGDGAGEEYGLRAGFEAGLMLAIDIRRWLEIRPEILFSTRGARFDSAGAIPALGISWDLNWEYVLTYVDIPVRVLLKSPVGRRVKPFAEAGGYVGFLAAAEVQRNETFTDPLFGTRQVDETDDIENDLEQVEAGVTLGAGLEFPVTRGALLVFARWRWGLTDVFEAEQGLEVRNGGFTIGIGYHF